MGISGRRWPLARKGSGRAGRGFIPRPPVENSRFCGWLGTSFAGVAGRPQNVVSVHRPPPVAHRDIHKTRASTPIARVRKSHGGSLSTLLHRFMWISRVVCSSHDPMHHPFVRESERSPAAVSPTLRGGQTRRDTHAVPHESASSAGGGGPCRQRGLRAGVASSSPSRPSIWVGSRAPVRGVGDFRAVRSVKPCPSP